MKYWIGCLEFISEEILGKFKKRSNFEAFFRPSTLKLKSAKKIYGRICVYRVFHLPIFRRGGGRGS